MIKKNATLTEVVLGMLLVIGIFVGLFLWYKVNIESAGVTLDPTQSAAYTNINKQINSTESVVNNIVDAANNVTETSSLYVVAIYGIKGLIEVVKLPLKFLAIAKESFLSFITMLELPSWIVTIISIAIIVVIVLIVIGIWKGEPKT